SILLNQNINFTYNPLSDQDTNLSINMRDTNNLLSDQDINLPDNLLPDQDTNFSENLLLNQETDLPDNISNQENECEELPENEDIQELVIYVGLLFENWGH
ncbi:19283_t:CDS:1, partial [Racocetra persica]